MVYGGVRWCTEGDGGEGRWCTVVYECEYWCRVVSGGVLWCLNVSSGVG